MVMGSKHCCGIEAVCPFFSLINREGTAMTARNLFKDGGFLIHHEYGVYGWWNHFVSVGRIPPFLAKQGM
uniref:hypothetical protein n=1 Tax=Akkermansia sp. TaxID=1872421 RepID=UPI003AB476A5